MEIYPIETAPKDGRYIIVFGDSGYLTTPFRSEICRWYPEYRPLSPWVNHANDCFEDGGPAPLYWSPLPDWTQEQLNSLNITIQTGNKN